jgi:hypothetical protein
MPWYRVYSELTQRYEIEIEANTKEEAIKKAISETMGEWTAVDDAISQTIIEDEVEELEDDE